MAIHHRLRGHCFNALCTAVLCCAAIGPQALAEQTLSEPVAGGPAATTLKVGLDLWPGYFPLIIAKQRDLFTSRGLQVDYFIPENTDKMLSAFKRGELDAICVALGDVFRLLPSQPGSRVVMVSDLSAGGDALLTLKPLPSRLDGLRIGTNLGGFGELFVEEFLGSYHSQIEQISLHNIDASQALAALKLNQVDVAHSWEPYVSKATDNGARIVFTSRQTPGLIPDVVLFNAEALAQRPDAVRGFVAAWLEAVDWWQQHPLAAKKLIADELTSDDFSLRGIKLMTSSDNIKTFKNYLSPRALPQVVERYIQFFEDSNALPSGLLTRDVIDGRFLPASSAVSTTQ